MLDGFAVVFLALAGALPAGLAAYRHGYWKGKREGRAENLVAACGLGDVAPGGLFQVPGSVPDPLAVPGVASSPVPGGFVGAWRGDAPPLAGAGDGRPGIVLGIGVDLDGAVDDFLESVVMSEVGRADAEGFRIHRDGEFFLARRVARALYKRVVAAQAGGVSQSHLDTDTPIR